MGYFEDLLKSPLPSSDESYLEGSDDFDFDKDIESSMGDFKEDDTDDLEEDGDDVDDLMSSIAAGDDDLDDDEDEDDDDIGDEDDDDIDDDLSDLEQEVGVNGGIDADDGDEDTFIPASVDDPTPAPELSPEEDKAADKSLAVLATPLVVDETFTAEEAAEFTENGEAEIAVSEGFMMESTLSEMLADLGGTDSYMESVFANPNQKYKMTKKARFNQLYELSLQIEARHHNDPYYKKLQKAYKIERTIKKGFRKRYHAAAVKRAKRYLKQLSHSKSPMLRKAANSFKPSGK